jgi:transglutaminase-like putative cysteine protease
VYLGDVRSPTRLTSRDAISRESGKSPPKVVLAGIPAGNAGAVATLKIMRQFVRAAVRNPDQIVRAKALSLVGFLPARDWIGQIKSCFEFVRDSIRYVKDPVDVELVQTPESSLDIGQGDCDDKATLLAALLMTIGHPCRFVALGFRGEGFSHVLVETRVRDGWMSLETILPVPMGWYPSGVTRRYVLKV